MVGGEPGAAAVDEPVAPVDGALTGGVDGRGDEGFTEPGALALGAVSPGRLGETLALVLAFEPAAVSAPAVEAAPLDDIED